MCTMAHITVFKGPTVSSYGSPAMRGSSQVGITVAVASVSALLEMI